MLKCKKTVNYVKKQTESAIRQKNEKRVRKDSLFVHKGKLKKTLYT